MLRPFEFFNSRKSNPCHLIQIITVLCIFLSTSIVALPITLQLKVHDMCSFASCHSVYRQQRNVLTNVQRHTSIPSPFYSLNQRSKLFSSANSINNIPEESESKAPPKNVAIVGGGLAGLSTAYHLLRYSIDHSIELPSVTILDKAEPGKGGASSVAGGLLHPFSPRGKLMYLGKEGLQVTNSLIQIAQTHEPECVLREKLYRLALTEKNVKDLQNTASLYPDLATWISSEDIESQCGSSTNCQGGVEMTNGCKVIHVPTYLQGLWKACEYLSGSTATWSLIDDEQTELDSSTDLWKDRLDSFDTVIFSAGSGLFADKILQQEAIGFPVEIVRGQSVEMTLDDDVVSTQPNFSNEALLCGKYVVPLEGGNKVLIGATHEYKKVPLNPDDVVEDLRSRSYDISQFVWDNGHVDRITIGYRVQSKRGKYGRLPIIGKAQYDDIHRNSWIFTGLSARGLIYHGVFGKYLSRAVMEANEDEILGEVPEAFWWKNVN